MILKWMTLPVWSYKHGTDDIVMVTAGSILVRVCLQSDRITAVDSDTVRDARPYRLYLFGDTLIDLHKDYDPHLKEIDE